MAAKKKAPKIEFVPCADEVAPPARSAAVGAIVDRDPDHASSRVFEAPNGRWGLAVVPAAKFPYHLLIVDVEGGSTREVALAPENFSAPCFHPDGDRALVIRGHKEVYEVTLTTGEARLIHDLRGKVPRAYGALYGAEQTVVVVCDQCTLLLRPDASPEPIDQHDTAGFSAHAALGGDCALALTGPGKVTWVVPLVVKGGKLHALKKVKRPGLFLWTDGDRVLSSDGAPPKERWELKGLREGLDVLAE
jgi:hypothetical protein